MKKALYLLLCLFALTLQAKPIIIKGKINGKLPENLYYTAPVNGALGFILSHTAPVNVNGTFEIKTDSDSVTFIDLFYNFQPAGYIVAQPGGSYTITITENQGSVTNTITGTDAEMQKRYNAIMANTHREMPFYELSTEAAKIESLTAFNAFFDTKLKADLEALGVTNTKVVPASTAKALLSERKYYYACAKSYAILLKHLKEDYPASELEVFSKEWKGVFDGFDMADTGIQKDPCGGQFIENYKHYRQFTAAGFDQKNINHNTDEVSVTKRNAALIPAQNAEYYNAFMLHNLLIGGQKEQSTLQMFSDFKTQYPKSGFTTFLEDDIAPVAAFYASSNNLPAGALYVENYAGINSLDELIKKFPGKKLYFDVWATWCGPCRAEFKHKDELYKLLQAYDVTVVYVSLDTQEKDETWKKMIPYYGLTGHHLRANEKLDENISYTYSGSRNIGLPWYFLVNANGQIAIKYAAPPSDLKKLEAELKKL